MRLFHVEKRLPTILVSHLGIPLCGGPPTDKFTVQLMLRLQNKGRGDTERIGNDAFKIAFKVTIDVEGALPRRCDLADMLDLDIIIVTDLSTTHSTWRLTTRVSEAQLILTVCTFLNQRLPCTWLRRTRVFPSSCGQRVQGHQYCKE